VHCAFAQNCVSSEFHFCIHAATRPFTWVVNNLVKPQVPLVQGETYRFQMVNVPSIHHFYISISAVGGEGSSSSDHVTDGVSPLRVNGNQVLTWVVPTNETLPPIYYQCEDHPDMGNRFMFIPPPLSSLSPTPTPQASSSPGREAVELLSQELEEMLFLENHH